MGSGFGGGGSTISSNGNGFMGNDIPDTIGISGCTMAKIILDFIINSPIQDKVSSRDVGRYLKSITLASSSSSSTNSNDGNNDNNDNDIENLSTTTPSSINNNNNNNNNSNNNILNELKYELGGLRSLVQDQMKHIFQTVDKEFTISSNNKKEKDNSYW